MKERDQKNKRGGGNKDNANKKDRPLRIMILTQVSQIYSSIILDKLVKEKFNIIGVATSNKIMPKRGVFSSLLKVANDSGYLYLFFRTLEAAYHKFLQVINPSKYYSVSKIIKKYNLPHYKIDDLGDSRTVDLIKKKDPDLLVSIYFNLIIKKDILKIPKNGCINIHRALLPRYRGPSSAFWQLSNNEKNTGVTIHYIDAGVDSGSVLSQKFFKINPKDTLHSLCYKSAFIGGGMLIDVINKIEKGNIKGIRQDDKKATSHTFPTKKAMYNFLKNSKRFF